MTSASKSETVDAERRWSNPRSPARVPKHRPLIGLVVRLPKARALDFIRLPRSGRLSPAHPPNLVQPKGAGCDLFATHCLQEVP